MCFFSWSEIIRVKVIVKEGTNIISNSILQMVFKFKGYLIFSCIGFQAIKRLKVFRNYVQVHVWL